MGVLVWVLVTPLLTQLPANVPTKVGEGGQNIWAPASYVGEPDGVPGSGLWPGPNLAPVAMCGVNQRMEDVFLILPLLSLFQINKINNKKKFSLDFKDLPSTSPTFKTKSVGLALWHSRLGLYPRCKHPT